MKKLFSVFLCLAICLSVDAYHFAVYGIYYNIIDDGQVEVTGIDYSYPGTFSYDGSLVIPSSVTYNLVSYKVTGIGWSAFYNCSSLTSVTIPSSVTTIGNSAFERCSGLTSVSIPNSVTSIGKSAFERCSGLTSVSIPNSVTSIGKSAFENCSGLTSVTIPNSVTSIDTSAFYKCYSLTSVSIPNSVIFIGKSAFEYCNSLTSVTIGNSVASIGDHAFAGCVRFTDITCHAAVPPVVQQTTFEYYDVALYVPANSVDLYSSTRYWKDFFIRAMPEEPVALDYNLADRNVIYVNGRVYNENGLDIKLFDASGRLISTGTNDIEMSSYPNGIYIVTDGKGGFMKINHYR